MRNESIIFLILRLINESRVCVLSEILALLLP